MSKLITRGIYRKEFYMRKIIVLILCIVFSLNNVFSDEKGYEIAKKNSDLPKSTTEKIQFTMVLLNKSGKQRIRKLLQYSEEHDNGTKIFLQFLEPADIAGTKFLTIENDKGENEQRLFLPELGKIRRIAASSKDSSFMGSDLYYYDLENHNLDDFTYTFIKEEKYDDFDCWVIDSLPKDNNAPYSKMRLWINKNDHFRYKLDCYDKRIAISW